MVNGVDELADVVGLSGVIGTLAVKFPETWEMKTRDEFHWVM